MTITNQASPGETMDQINTLSQQLETATPPQQLDLIKKLASLGEQAWPTLQQFLSRNASQPVTPAMGTAYQTLAQCGDTTVKVFLATRFGKGVVPLRSQRNIDYQPLQELLVAGKFLEADLLTVKKMCELAGPMSVKRKWLYFTEVSQFPPEDLHTIDQLWLTYSEGRFGFSVQRKIWLSVGKDYNKFWPKIKWRKENIWTRYPNQFIWDLSAPKGHLPTTNQLRGSRVIDALFSHPLWSSDLVQG